MPTLATSPNLFVQYHELRQRSPDSKAAIVLRNRIASVNMGLVRKVARKQSQQCAEPYEDLVQIGSFGLITAIERFDPTMGIQFSSYAVPWIKGAIQHFLRDRWGLVKVPRRWVEAHSSVKRTQRIMVQHGRDLPEETIALSTGIEVDKWRQIKEAIDRKPLLDLDELHETIGAEGVDVEDNHTMLHELIGRLENPYRLLLIGCCVAGQSIADMATQLNLDPTEAGELLREAKEWLRNHLEHVSDRTTHP